MSLQGLRNWLKNGSWGLKLLSLALAVVVYYAMKAESARSGHPRTATHDRNIFQSR